MKLLVLSASTGGGHDMRAFALRDWWRQMGGDCQVYHPLEETFWGYKSGCQLYNLIQRKLPLLHYAYFNFLEFASIHHSPAKIIGAKKFTQKVRSFSPDLIVSTHAHLNHGYFELSRNSQSKTSRFVVYCGELADGHGFSKHWVNPRNDLFISPFKEGSLAARRRGMPVSRILVGGPLLREPFYRDNQRFNSSKVYSDHGLDSIKPIFLLGTGANGVNHHLSIIKAISQAGVDCQILALCGRNEQTFQAIKRLSISNPQKVLPFRRLEASTMVDLLNVSTWMLARPGAGLTTEAVVTGCPVIFDLSGGCMPQETNNLNFWKGRVGHLLTSSSPGQLIQNIQSGLKVPRLFIPIENAPNLLLRKLSELVEA